MNSKLSVPTSRDYKLPPGYRLLRVGEEIHNTDLVFMDMYGWIPTYFGGEDADMLFRHARSKKL